MKILKVFLPILAIATIFSSCDPETVPDEVDVASEIEGKWWCEDNDGLTYNVTVNKIADNKIKIENFNNLGESESVSVDVYDDNTMVLTEQSVSTVTVNGSGTISPGYESMQLDYTVTDQDGPYEVSASYSLGTVSKRKLQ